jgi:hypothetical protein
MTFVNRLTSLRVAEDSLATLTYEEGTDVFHFNETEVETAIAETSVISELASLISDSKLDVRTRWNGNILEHLRSENYLENYERGSYECEYFIADTITDNFHDVDLIECSTKKYDNKRGFTTLTAEVQVPVANLIEQAPFLAGWTISVETENGTITFDV